MAKDTPGKAVATKTFDDGVRKKQERASGLLSKMIQRKIGSRQEPFQVHKDIVCSSSPFFRKACNGPWKERDGWVELPEDDPNIFEIYVQWLYLDTVNIEALGSQSIYSLYIKCFLCFKLGDKLLDITFKNAVIDAMIESFKIHGQFPRSQANHIYRALPESSAYRRLYLDVWAWVGRVAWYKAGGDIDHAPRKFFVDLAKRQHEIGERKYWLGEEAPWISDPCQYHEHPEGTPKCSKNPAQ